MANNKELERILNLDTQNGNRLRDQMAESDTELRRLNEQCLHLRERRTIMEDEILRLNQDEGVTDQESVEYRRTIDTLI